MEIKLYSPDIECESCTAVLTRVFKNLQGIKSYSFNKKEINVSFDEALITKENIIAAIQNKGYRTSENSFSKKTITERTKDFIQNKTKYKIEYKMLKYIFISFILLAGINYGILNITNSLQSHFWWIFYLTISIPFISGAIWHYKTYQSQFTCMLGMMIGMTIGMQTGMMIGAIIGITNGFFYGATIGMLLGSLVGVYTGNCCGIMGVMEGLMAGIMGGTMGAMITVMMFYDNILIFMPIYYILNIIILIGFSYMLYEEVAEDNPNIKIKEINFVKFISWTFLLNILLIGVIYYAPKSVFLA